MKTVVNVGAVVLAFCALSACIATKQTYVARGNKLYDAGKYADASLNYRKAIQKDSQYGEAYYRLGLAAIKERQPREAYDALYRATQLLPDRVDVMEKFSTVCLSYYLADPKHPQVLYRQITQLSKDLLAKNPNSYQGLVLKAYLASTDRKSTEAIEDFRRALKVDSSDAGVVTSLAALLIQDGQAEEGEKLALDLVSRQKTSYAPAYDLLYALYSGKRPAEAENILKLKVANNPTNAGYFLELAKYYSNQQKTPEMKATLQRLLDDAKDFPNARLSVGDFYMDLRDYPTAIRYYDEGARAKSGDEKSVYQNRTLIALLTQGKNEDGLKLADQIIHENPKDDEAQTLRADLWLDSGKADNIEAALHTFQELVKRNPNNATLHVHLGRAYRKKGDLGSAVKQFQQALAIHSGLVDANYELGLVSLMRGQPTEALERANTILASRPDYRQARLLRTESLIRLGDLKTASTELNALAKETPQDSQIQFQMALMALRNRKFPEAMDTLNRLRSTGDARVFVGLAALYAGRGDFGQAFEVLDEGLKKSGDGFMIHNQMASTALMAHQYDRAIAEFRKVLELDPKSILTMRRIGDVYELKGSMDDALKMFRQAYDAQPNNVDSAMALAGALAQAGHTAEARTQFLGIAKAHPEDPTVLNNTAYLLADSGGDLDEALRLAKSALAKAPDHAAYSDTVGYVYLKQGLKDSAIQTFGALVRKYPHYPAFRYHLGLALYEKGDKAAARRELQTALADHPSGPDEERIKDLLKKLA